LIDSKTARLREEILTLADAWVRAGSEYKVPLGKWAEDALDKAARQMAAGLKSAFFGEMKLDAPRTRTPLDVPAGSRRIDGALNTLREAKLRLKAQRIAFGRSVAKAGIQSVQNQQRSEVVAGTKKKRLRSTVHSPIAARRMEVYMESHGGQTAFAIKVDTTDRTLRSFRNTGRIRRDIFHNIAVAMGTTAEELQKPE
jgi:hypothetical protein